MISEHPQIARLGRSFVRRRRDFVGIGQPAAGDDAVGLLVARALAAQGVAALESTDATVLLPLLAEGRSVVGSVLRSALATALLGIGVGLAAAYALTRTIASFLYDVSPTDPATAVAVVGVLLAVAAVAAFVPARRAATVNPMVALRADG